MSLGPLSRFETPARQGFNVRRDPPKLRSRSRATRGLPGEESALAQVALHLRVCISSQMSG